VRRLGAADGAERHHAAETRHLAVRQGVVGMVLETRVVHLGDPWVGGEEAGDGLRVGAVALHAHRQCLHPSLHEEGVERPRHRPGGVL
jgi:hypothetical protein